MSDKKEKKVFHGGDEEDPDADNTTAPLLLSEKVKSDLTRLTFFMLRLTPENDNYSLQDVTEFMGDLSLHNVWFVSEEQSKKGIKHYHTVFAQPNGLDPRQDIKNWLLEKFPSKWKKQDGNKRYNLQEVKELEKAFTYTSKDGDYVIGKGINPDYIAYVNSKSFQKKDTRVGQLIESRQLYIQGQMTERELFDSVCDVCISTSLTGSLNMTYVKCFMTGAKAQKDPKFRDQLYKLLGL